MKEQLIAPPPEMVIQKVTQLDRVLTIIKEANDYWWEKGWHREVLFTDSRNLTWSIRLDETKIRELSKSAFAMITDLREWGYKDLANEIVEKYTGAGERR